MIFVWRCVRYVGLLLSTIFRFFSLQFRKITMSEHPNVYDMAYGVCIIIFPNPTMMATGQWDFYICCAVVLLSRLRILGWDRFDSKLKLGKSLFLKQTTGGNKWCTVVKRVIFTQEFCCFFRLILRHPKNNFEINWSLKCCPYLFI